MSFKLLFWNLLNFVCPKIYLVTVERPTMGNEKEDGVFVRKLQSVVIRGRMRVLLSGLGRKNNITQH